MVLVGTSCFDEVSLAEIVVLGSQFRQNLINFRVCLIALERSS